MSGAKARDTRLVLAGEPRVQLLPRFVQEREKARVARRMLVLLVILALVAVAAGYAFGLLRSGVAASALADAHVRTQEILAEQGTYAEGTRVANQVAQTEESQKVVTSLEILWAPLLDQIKSMLPAGAAFDSVTVTGQAPWEAELLPAGPLRAPHIAEFVIVVQSDAAIDAVQLTTNLATLLGYSDSVVQSTTTDGGKVKTTISLTMDPEAISGRYLPGAENPTDPVPGPVPAAPTPTPTKGVVP